MRLAEKEDDRVRKQENSKHVNFLRMMKCGSVIKKLGMLKPTSQKWSHAQRGDFYDDHYYQLKKKVLVCRLLRGGMSLSVLHWVEWGVQQTLKPPARVNLSQQNMLSQTEEQRVCHLEWREVTPCGSKTFAPRGRRNWRYLRQPTRNQRNIPECNWCGRWGHAKDDCWDRLGACTACGDFTHCRVE